jgi:hypothetical protein
MIEIRPIKQDFQQYQEKMGDESKTNKSNVASISS